MLLKEKLKDKKLILASRSPRRRELLAGCGLEFTIAPDYEVDESCPGGMPAREVPLYLARLKSEAYPWPLAVDEIVVTADTVVILGDEVLGKPKDCAQALGMLGRLSGNRHTVVTGVALRDAAHTVSFAAMSDVWVRDLNAGEIEYYVDTYKPFDKAGAYGIQEWFGFVAVSRIEGSFYNVMGLPVQRLYVELDKFIK